MAEEMVGVDPAIEAEAATMGWVPQEKYKGKPETWLPADRFVEKGKQIMPILQRNNQRLVAETQMTKEELAAVKEQLKLQNKTIQDMKEFQAKEVKRQVEDRMKQLKREMRSAEREGNHELADTLSEEIDELKETVIPIAPTPASPPAAPPPPAVEPWANTFYLEHKEFLDDPINAKRFLTECEIVNQTEGLTKTALAEKALENLKGRKAIPPTKVEGGGRSGETSSGPRKKGFSDLSSDAKEVCKQQAQKFVGEGKAFKTESEWQSHYAGVYFGEE